jgi:hypothetical protein
MLPLRLAHVVSRAEFRFGLVGWCSGEAERGGGVAAARGGGRRGAGPAGGAVGGGVPPRPPQRPDPLQRAQQGPPGRRPEGEPPAHSSCSIIWLAPPLSPSPPAPARVSSADTRQCFPRAGGHGGLGRRRGAVGVPVLRERAQLPRGGAGHRPALLRGLRFGAGSSCVCRSVPTPTGPCSLACLLLQQSAYDGASLL